MTKTPSKNVTVVEVRSHGHGDSTTYYPLSLGAWAPMSRFHAQWLADQINDGKITLPEEPKQHRGKSYEERISEAKTAEEKMSLIIENDIYNIMKESVKDAFRAK